MLGGKVAQICIDHDCLSRSLALELTCLKIHNSREELVNSNKFE